MKPHVTRRRRTPSEPAPAPDFHSMVASRLEAGRIEYGDTSARTKSLMRLAMEIREEFADVGGWARIFRDRCELMGIDIPPKIERLLESLDVAAVAGFAVLDELEQWARGVERGE